MEFFDYPTIYGFAHRQGLTADTPVIFYRRGLAILDDRCRRGGPPQSVDFNHWASELGWYAAERPYYKVWPAVIPLLAGVGIEVPVEYLRLPFASMLLRFPKTENPLPVAPGYVVRSILVSQGASEDHQRRIFLWFDIGETEPDGSPLVTYCQLDCQPGFDIEQAFHHLLRTKTEGVEIPLELQEQCLRIAVSVCFLATGADRLVDADVLGKDLARYRESRERDPEAARQIVERAKRRGKHGWNIGQHERLLPLSRQEAGSGTGTGAHGHLTHQHQRRAHFRVLSSGKVTFVRQATVRPDLPPPSVATGYRVK